MARMAIGADEKKKLIVLGGLLAAIGIVVVVLYIPKGGSEDTADTGTPPAKTATAKTPADAAPVPGGDSPAPASSGGAPVGGITAASLVSVERYRTDPFEPFPLPPPLPKPPPPPPPVSIPAPVEIVPPEQMGGGSGGFGLPPMGLNRVTGSRPLADLPPLRQPRVAIAPTAPRNYLPAGADGGGGGTMRAQNKRLSGVVIGDSVRALLEITEGETVTTRVVQPGDEVDGIRILRLERIVDGGRTITRMVVRENNQEQYVELRAAPQATGEGGAAGGGIRPGGGRPGGAPF